MNVNAALIPVVLGALALTGCDTIHGVSRTAQVHALPDLLLVKARIESYPEAMEVELLQLEGGRPLTWTGIQKAEEDFYVRYDDRANIHGTLQFARDYTGKIVYSQCLTRLNHRPPQQWIDATWPIMKRIEQDLAQDFGLRELFDSVDVDVFGGVKDPERPMVGDAP